MAWQGVRGESAADILPILNSLVEQYGAPLVMKSDNGSAFLAELTSVCWQSHGTALLFSPPRRPQYNGALERSNATLKAYTHQQALAADHPWRWTSTDVNQAQSLANTWTRPWGHEGPSPDEAWSTRAPLMPTERLHFDQRLAQHRQQAARDLGLDLTAELDHINRSRLNRLAIARTLEELGYLSKLPVTRAPRMKRKRKRLSKRNRTPTLIKPEASSITNQLAVTCADEQLSPHDTTHFSVDTLAAAQPHDTMHAPSPLGECPPPSDAAPPIGTSAQREPTNDPWFRKAIALVVSVLKAAIDWG